MTRFLLPALALASALLLTACGDSDEGSGDDGATTTKRSTPTTTTKAPSTTGSDTAPKLQLVKVGEFEEPVYATAVPGTDFIAVVEKVGRVRVASDMACVARDNCPAEPVTAGKVVVDLSDKVSDGGEQGLLGLAFHPKWPDDPRIFLNYTDRDGDTHIEAWNLESPRAPATRARELLRIEQPYENHNGGNLAFGPDGLLYIGTGDGGSGGDPEDRAQTDEELLGKMLRLDVDGGGERGYAIPPGNLSKDSPVWAVGLRNPWRYSFDRETGDLWIGDVGQNAFEEVDALSREQLDDSPPPNFQWRQREGFDAFEDPGRKGPGRSTGPVLDYGRDDGCSITGGYVYRGQTIPDLAGWYVFADFCESDLRLVRTTGVPGTQPKRGAVKFVSQGGIGQISSFGETRSGELLVVSTSGTIHQIVAAG